MQQNKTKKKYPLYYYFILVLIPVIFFILLEIILRLTGYGFNNKQWISAGKDKLILNPEIAKRYFKTSGIPYSIQDVFDKVKKENSFRIFVMGGSSAAGYPFLPVGSFSRYLNRILEAAYPDIHFEVINISMTAISSYTLKDFFPGVLEKKPDLVIIYAGHNEYYGALGVGSAESYGSSGFITDFILYLNNFKTTELISDGLKAATGIFSDDEKVKDGTLMSRMAQDQYIPLNSEKYFAGLKQFEKNIKEILSKASNKKIPVILSTLTSNLKDQPPFISEETPELPSAQVTYKRAWEKLERNEFDSAKVLFTYAKDLDLLRFRSPSEINNIIQRLSNEFNLPTVKIDTVFDERSPDKITGKNLMTDHLHPTLEGYKIMAKLFYDEIRKSPSLKKFNSLIKPDSIIYNQAEKNFYFSTLDSVIADYRIISLKNDWPFTDKKKSLENLIEIKNKIDSIAFDFINGNQTWEKAQRNAAIHYLQNRKYDLFQYQMNVLISQYPLIVEYYNFTANELLKIQKYDEAYSYLVKRYEIEPDAFSAKWLGTINLYNNKVDEAVNYLEESLQHNSQDAQVLYNLSGAYVIKNNFKNALVKIERCLNISPDYPNAAELRNQILIKHK
jgi:tetratricopeptide (TPR) repeat protein